MGPVATRFGQELLDVVDLERGVYQGRAVDVAGMDEFEAETPGGHLEGMTVRLYNADTHDWSIYSSSGKTGAFSSPAGVGRFVNGRGEFYEHEELDGRPMYVRASCVPPGFGVPVPGV